MPRQGRGHHTLQAREPDPEDQTRKATPGSLGQQVVAPAKGSWRPTPHSWQTHPGVGRVAPRYPVTELVGKGAETAKALDRATGPRSVSSGPPPPRRRTSSQGRSKS